MPETKPRRKRISTPRKSLGSSQRKSKNRPASDDDIARLHRDCLEVIAAHKKAQEACALLGRSRSRAQVEWASCDNLRGYFRQSQGQFMQQATQVLDGNGVTIQRLEALKAAIVKLEDDLEALDKQSIATRDAERILEGLEYQAELQIGSTTETLQRFAMDCERFSAAIVNDLPSTPGVRERQTDQAQPYDFPEPFASPMDEHALSSITDIGVDGVVSAYFDAAEDVQSIGEELAELDQEDHDARVAHNLREDQEGISSQNDWNHEEYASRRTQIEKRLDAAIAEMDARRRECEMMGIDLYALENTVPVLASETLSDNTNVKKHSSTPEYTPKVRPTAIESTAPSVTLLGDGQPMEPWDSSTGGFPSLSTCTDYSMDKQNIIQRWAMEVPLNAPDVEPGSPRAECEDIPNDERNDPEDIPSHIIEEAPHPPSLRDVAVTQLHKAERHIATRRSPGETPDAYSTRAVEVMRLDLADFRKDPRPIASTYDTPGRGNSSDQAASTERAAPRAVSRRASAPARLFKQYGSMQET